MVARLHHEGVTLPREAWLCVGCNKEFAPRRRARMQWVPVFFTVLEGEPPDAEAYPVCGRCWRRFWVELKRANPWLEGGMPF